MNKKEFLEFERQMRHLIQYQKEERKISSVVKSDIPTWDVSCGFHVYNFDFNMDIEIEWCKDWNKVDEVKNYINQLVKQHCIPVNHLSTQGEIHWKGDHVLLDYGMCLDTNDDEEDSIWSKNILIKIEKK